MTEYIPFVSTPTDIEIFNRFYKYCDMIRVSYENIDRNESVFDLITYTPFDFYFETKKLIMPNEINMASSVLIVLVD